ncbi:Ig-like domain-containing protein, partial [Vibrio europaeus]|uniref:Ig-like domain-containing protein n=1 Tax=Vibrio europaeus TaxID=300876 RepID=UPI00233E7005
MGFGTYVAMGNLAANQVIVIDVNGNIRVLVEGELPRPGEVIVQSDADAVVNNQQLQVELVDDGGEPQDITAEIEDIFAALEEGQDPTQLGEDFATAAGGQSGSSLTASGSISRDGTETIASTEFTTEGFQSLGLSQTQSLTLLDQFQLFEPIFVDLNSDPLGESIAVTTDEDTAISGTLTATDQNPTDTLTFSQTSSPTNGTAVVNPDGTWTYTPNTNFDGDDSFTVTVDDGNGGTDTLVVNVAVTPIPEITVSGGGDVSEGSDATYTISYDKPSTQDTTLRLTNQLNTAESDDIGSIQVQTSTGQTLTVNADGTVLVPAGTTSLNVTIPTTQDDIYEGDESFTLNVESVSGLVGNGSSQSTIKDDGVGSDNDVPSLSVSDAESIVEGNESSFDIVLSNDVDADLEYKIELDLGGSASIDDFVHTNGVVNLTVSYILEGVMQTSSVENGSTVTIPGNAKGIKVSVDTKDDVYLEGEESFGLVVTVSGNVGDSNTRFEVSNRGSGEITDEATPGTEDTVSVTLSGPDSIVEGETSSDYTVTLSDAAPAGTVITLSYSYTTASGDDIVETTQAVVGADGKTATFTIATVDDKLAEGSEAFTVSVSDVQTPSGDAVFEKLNLDNASKQTTIT